MRILLYEFIAGGGWYAVDDRQPPPVSLQREGRAMLIAVAADFAALPDTEVVVLRDRRWPDLELPGCRIVEVSAACAEFDSLSSWSEQSDWTLIIAPEFDGLLLERSRWVLEAGGRLLGPGLELIELASDKHATAQWLSAAGVKVPAGISVPAGELLPADFGYPAVWKPRDGAGSWGVRLVQPQDLGGSQPFVPERPGRLEQYCPGLPASVSWLCGPGGQSPLPPCSQLLGGNNVAIFEYQGGATPLPDHLAQRAVALTRSAVETLPGRSGYLGIDLVLAPREDGQDDTIIEINPRLTTSYVGLRHSANVNLAKALLDVILSRSPSLSFRTERVEFTSTGVVIIGTEPKT